MPLASLRNTHDVGFLIYNSAGNGYRLTQNTAYRTALLDAAASLASRFDADVGCTRSWDFGSWMFPVIIDNMMNLELLFRATMLGGEARFAQIGTTHAQTTNTNHFRADASSYHVVDYNPTTGAVIRKQTNQGVADESAWARGQAWGLYGFTMSYRETNDARFLNRATQIAEFYTKSARMPADGVPYFDFDAPVRDDVPTTATPRRAPSPPAGCSSSRSTRPAPRRRATARSRSRRCARCRRRATAPRPAPTVSSC